MPSKNEAEAFNKYKKAYHAYDQMLDVCFPVYPVSSEQQLKTARITKKTLRELNKLANEVEKKRKAWMKLYL